MAIIIGYQVVFGNTIVAFKRCKDQMETHQTHHRVVRVVDQNNAIKSPLSHFRKGMDQVASHLLSLFSKGRLVDCERNLVQVVN